MNPSAPKPPSTKGRDALEWLEYHGITPRRCIPIRSSDLGVALNDPFTYYLTRHLGLTSGVKYSKALTRGSWFHKRLEYFGRPDEVATSRMAGHLAARLKELETTCEVWGFNHDQFLTFKEREEKDFHCSMGWYEASRNITIPASSALGRPTTWEKYLSNPDFLIVGREIIAVIKDDLCPGCPLVAQFDMVIYDRRTNQIWLVDAKTCEESPTLRLATCPIEFQTQLYLYILNALHRSGLLHKKFPVIPENAVVGGMIHIGVQKPTIDFNKKVDRPFKFVHHTLKSGPRKGMIEVRKEYLSDEPSFPLYLERVQRWYKGEGEYVEEADARLLDPPVNLSWSGYNVVLDKMGMTEFKNRLAFLYQMASKDPHPDNFIMNVRSAKNRDGSLSDLGPFYLLPPSEWPTVVSTNRLIQTHRDDMISSNTPTGILENGSIEEADPAGSTN